MISTIALVLLGSALATPAPTPCEGLKSLQLPGTTIKVAELVPEGVYTPPPGGGPQQPQPVQLAAHCRVNAILKPSSDSEIEIEVWLPSENWNGKFQAVGNGGWAGVISYAAMANAVNEGYATASTDTGHKGGNALFAIGHPEKVVDFAYRAVHEMTVKAKAFLTAYYDRGPRLSYWNGCSTGGRQGLMSAQRYPEDFDAILAGAPANYQTHLHAWDLGVAVPVLKDTGAAVPAGKASFLNKAVLQACDARDGVKDGLLNDPRSCKFDPATLLCKGADAESCLTAAQLESVKRVYAPAKLKTGELVFPGKEPGSETGWQVIAGTANQPPGVSIGSFQVAYDTAQWDWRGFDLDRDLKIVDEKVGTIINAVNPDLSAFKARGGKLLLYHGWNDTAISPGNTINYYSTVLSKMGAKQDNWIRLFMAPGVAHCGNGPGPNQFNFMAALERWRESGIAPESITAYHVTNNKVDMTRPLCVYPELAQYKGTGSTSDASSFICKAPQIRGN
ncbi:MAG TPA: tannase/feruloyl esterase family alpha/beta hydrolase [Terriglobia bacterium]|nr:tannase/feruloyl esterase family alpha/beta hydrolase [Terriglobia bacterium]